MNEDPLNTTPGSADAFIEMSSSEGVAASCWEDRYHRKLAICSIICGMSCIGIKALILSVKAEKTEDSVKSAKYSRQARKYGIISIVVLVCCMALIPMLMALISYLLTLKD